MPYAIRQTRFFHAPEPDRTSYVTDSFKGGARAEWPTRAAAQAVCDQLDAAVYHTGHNESGRAEFRVVRIR